MKKSRIILLTLLSIFSSQILKAQSNTDLGVNAGNAGSYNSSFGYYAGDLVTGSYNTFTGHYAGKATTSGYCNVFSGAFTGYSNTTGDYNTYIGFRVCVLATEASRNTCVGYKSGTYISSGSYNTFCGGISGYRTSTGSRNVYLGFYCGYNATGSDNIFLGYQAGYSETGSNKLYVENSSSTSPLIYGEFDNDFVTINGKLGIGTTDFDNAQLAVNGTIKAKDILVTVDDFPDYVFEDGYKLQSLPDINSFIKAHGHLPGIKQEAQIKEEGLLLGELNVQILEKVEELTLHLIDLDTRANELIECSKMMQKEIDSLNDNK